MTTDPRPHFERLGRFGSIIAANIALFAPDHAWVKEFVRAYFGPEYATRTVIRTIAERLLTPEDALVGVSLELARAARGIITPADVRELLDATPRLPGDPVDFMEIDIHAFRSEILTQYDRKTVQRLLRSIVHTVAQEAARELEVEQLTPDALRYLLSIRNEHVIEDIIQWLARPIPPEFVGPVRTLLPELQTTDVRDAIFAAGILRNPQISTTCTRHELIATLRHAWGLGLNRSSVAVLTAVTNPDVIRRAPDDVLRWINRGLRSRDSAVRAAAIRTFASPEIRDNRGHAATNVLRAHLRTSSRETTTAVLDVLATGGTDLLGRHGQARFVRQLDHWANASTADANGRALDALERPALRRAVGPLVASRLLAQLRSSAFPRVQARATRVTQDYIAGSGVRPRIVGSVAPWTASVHAQEVLETIIRASLRSPHDPVPLPPAHSVTTWRDLDPGFDRPLDLPTIADQVDGLRLVDHSVRVLRTRRELTENAHRQRNCTQSWADKLDQGDRVLVAVEDDHGRVTCNADWVFENGSWRFGNAFAKFNDPRIDQDLRRSLVRMTELLNREPESATRIEAPASRAPQALPR